jgi:hypothetical protein
MIGRNAASVLPVPVGAAISVWWPERIFGQPRACGPEGSPMHSLNQAEIAGWNGVKGMGE